MLFDHTFIDNHAAKILVLLHGTGGTKSDFLFLNDAVRGHYNLLSLQGNILEGGMARFFRRTAPGVFDLENLKEETGKLHEFVQVWMKDHAQISDELVYLGYSNGANMILSLLFSHPSVVGKAVLLHPMLPFMPGDIDLTRKQVFVSSGQFDAMVPSKQQEALVRVLEEKGAEVIAKQYPGGHEISEQELQDVLAFLFKDK
jgi:phospholipase/carboxylesterase